MGQPETEIVSQNLYLIRYYLILVISLFGYQSLVNKKSWIWSIGLDVRLVIGWEIALLPFVFAHSYA